MDFQAQALRELTAVADKLADAAKQEVDAATAQLTANFNVTIDRLRTDHAQLINENERLNAENAALSWEKERLAEPASAGSRGALVDRLVDVLERISASRTVDEVLVATAHGLAGDFARVAVFKGTDRLVQLGAEAPLEPGSPTVVASSISVRGETLATLYAGDEIGPGGEGARLAVLLQRHATMALERLMIELKAIDELRAYARMLLDEVEYVFEADTTANVAASDRRERLKANLRCARQIYEQRVTLEGPAAAALLEEVVAVTVETKADTPFGCELLDVATDVDRMPSAQ
jgi:hypothetical protein